MTIKTQRKRFFVRNCDRNKKALQLAGRKARDVGRALEDCPNLQRYSGDSYMAELMKAWADGWTKRDLELRTQVLPMEGGAS